MAFSESVKLEVKRRAHFTCCWCGDRQRKVDIHHIVPQAEGGADDPATNVISFVAPGGIGKSALVNHWLDAVAADGWRGAERVLGWSFYSQGADAAGASSEAFTEFALDWLGYEGEPITSPWRKGEKIARRVRAAPTLLILDGLEPLQHPPGGGGSANAVVS